MTYLLDANALAALVIPQHEHHARAHRFFSRRAFAITPLTQLALLQILSRPRRVKDQLLPPLHTPAEALRLMRLLSHRRGVRFLPADINCASAMPFSGVTGHRQWNDLYLVALAEKNGLIWTANYGCATQERPEQEQTQETEEKNLCDLCSLFNFKWAACPVFACSMPLQSLRTRTTLRLPLAGGW